MPEDSQATLMRLIQRLLASGALVEIQKPSLSRQNSARRPSVQQNDSLNSSRRSSIQTDVAEKEHVALELQELKEEMKQLRETKDRELKAPAPLACVSKSMLGGVGQEGRGG